VHRDLPPTLRVRAIRYHHRGFRPRPSSPRYSTPSPIPRPNWWRHERWELELGFDEVKTHTLEREEALRSKTPTRIRQEVWGLALGYNLVRRAMARVADRADVAPTRISYRHALQFIRVFWLTALDHESRCLAPSPRGPARRTRPADPPRPPPVPALSSRGQDQDEQLPAQTSTTSEASP